MSTPTLLEDLAYVVELFERLKAADAKPVIIRIDDVGRTARLRDAARRLREEMASARGGSESGTWATRELFHGRLMLLERINGGPLGGPTP